jgi:hypothetical protein
MFAQSIFRRNAVFYIFKTFHLCTYYFSYSPFDDRSLREISIPVSSPNEAQLTEQQIIFHIISAKTNPIEHI